MKLLKVAEKAIRKHVKAELPGFSIESIVHLGYGIYHIDVKSMCRIGTLRAYTDWEKNPEDGIVLQVEGLAYLENKFSVPEDFEYKGHLCLYLPHPKLTGDWEIYKLDGEGESILGRASSPEDCKVRIDRNIKYYTR